MPAVETTPAAAVDVLPPAVRLTSAPPTSDTSVVTAAATLAMLALIGTRPPATVEICCAAVPVALATPLSALAVVAVELVIAVMAAVVPETGVPAPVVDAPLVLTAQTSPVAWCAVTAG